MKTQRLFFIASLAILGMPLLAQADLVIRDTFDLVTSAPFNTQGFSVNTEVGTVGQIRQAGLLEPMFWGDFGETVEASGHALRVDATNNGDTFGDNALRTRASGSGVPSTAVSAPMPFSYTLALDHRFSDGQASIAWLSVRAGTPLLNASTGGNPTSGVAIAFFGNQTGDTTATHYSVYVDGRFDSSNNPDGHILHEGTPLPTGAADGDWESLQIDLSGNIIRAFMNGIPLDLDGAGADGTDDGWLDLNQPIQGDSSILAATGQFNNIWLSGGQRAGADFWDNFEVVASPEPSTAWLLLSGGLLVAGRRRVW